MFQSKLNFLCHCCPNLWYFQASKPWKYQFSLGKINVFQVFAKSMFVRISCIFPSKNHQKTLPKRGPNPSKIDAENVLIFNIDFLRFWPRFGRVLGLQDFGASGPEFWRVWGRFLEIFESFLACCLEDVPPVLLPGVPPSISPMLVQPVRLKRWEFV